MSDSAIELEKTLTAAPLFLTITQEGVGGVTGVVPTVALRDATTSNKYWDWMNNIWSTGGPWGQKYAPLSPIEKGHYQRPLNLVTVGAQSGDVYAAEYHVDNGGDVIGDAADLLIIVEEAGDLAVVKADIEVLRKALTNRLEEYPGNPGHLILFDDDGLTPIKTWELRDAAGGPIVSTVGAPSRRSRGV